jgi:hypothetical protein
MFIDLLMLGLHGVIIFALYLNLFLFWFPIFCPLVFYVCFFFMLSDFSKVAQIKEKNTS